MELERQKAVQALKRVKLRQSPIRVMVMETFFRYRRALTHQELMEKLPRGTDKVTVYRTLHTLVENELLHAIKTQDRSLSYAPSRVREEGHVHIQCTECGTVACVDEPVPPPAAKGGWVVREQETLWFGTCPDCVSA